VGLSLSWPVVAAVLFGALLHAGWNALVKSSQDKALDTALIHLLGSVVAIPLVLVLGWPPAAATNGATSYAPPVSSLHGKAHNPDGKDDGPRVAPPIPGYERISGMRADLGDATAEATVSLSAASIFDAAEATFSLSAASIFDAADDNASPTDGPRGGGLSAAAVAERDAERRSLTITLIRHSRPGLR
jgi:hypothetical protein